MCLYIRMGAVNHQTIRNAAQTLSLVLCININVPPIFAAQNAIALSFDAFRCLAPNPTLLCCLRCASGRNSESEESVGDGSRFPDDGDNCPRD